MFKVSGSKKGSISLWADQMTRYRIIQCQEKLYLFYIITYSYVWIERKKRIDVIDVGQKIWMDLDVEQ